MPNDIGHKLQAMLAEYNAYKTEVNNRTSVQNALLRLHVTALTVIIGTMIVQPDFGPWLIFLVPIESAMFGLLWLDHATRIEELGQFFAEIERNVSDLLKHPGIMSMENRFADLSHSEVRRPIAPGLLFVLTFGGSCLLTFPAVLVLWLADPSVYTGSSERLILSIFLLILDLSLLILYALSARHFLSFRKGVGGKLPIRISSLSGIRSRRSR